MESDIDNDFQSGSSDDSSDSGSDLETADDFSDHSFDSNTDSEEEQDTCSTLQSLDSQVSEIDDDFWYDELHDVEIGEFDEHTGPVHNLTPNNNIVDYFYLMFSEEFFSKLTDETNKYAKQKIENVNGRENNWQDTIIPEMKAFVGLQILMGVVNLPRSKMYWSSDRFLGNQGFQNTMSRNRWDKLQEYFHINDNSTRAEPGSQDFDRLHKLRPLIAMTRKNFPNAYNPGKNQTIDEGMVRYKGRFFTKQFEPYKPIKRGLKIWMRCESSSGYCSDYMPYLGKHDVFRGKNLGERVVKHLVRPLKWKSHHVFFDRFFTTIPLVRALENNGIYACGTIKSPSVGLPKDLLNPVLQRGDSLQKQHDNIVFTAWQDRKMVHTLSTLCNPVGDDPVVRHVPRGREIEISRPPPVTEYQRNMGGVDRCMQHRSKNPVGRPSKKYWKYMFNFILEVCLINAHIIWQEQVNLEHLIS